MPLCEHYSTLTLTLTLTRWQLRRVCHPLCHPLTRCAPAEKSRPLCAPPPLSEQDWSLQRID